jgi:acetyltransferase-like isoleucine patch superfamily enzyme
MRPLPDRLRRGPEPGVRRGRDVVVARRVSLQVNAGAELVLGDGCRIGEATRITVAAGRVELGACALLGERCTLVAHSAIAIGARARLGHGVVIVDFDHVFSDVERPIRVQPLQSGPVTIGDDARIGFGVCIVRGVAIGAGATVDPHSVVTRDVAPGAHVGGVPAKALPAVARPEAAP